MIAEWIEALLTSTSLTGYYVLLATFPLTLIQGILGLFPYSILILLNISSMGLISGLLASWISSIIVANIVFHGCRSFFADWFSRKIKKKEGRFEKWQRYFELYGVWTLILLRTIPIIPNNAISLMAAVSTMKSIPYFISTVIGNLSQIWLYGIISWTILMPNQDRSLSIWLYVSFCLILIIVFFLDQFKQRKKGTNVKVNHVG